MIRYNLQLTLTSPLIHTEGVDSNIATLYRERRHTQDGKTHQIPIYKGNAMRGLMRNIIFDDMLEQIEAEPESIPLSMFHILFNGGTLDKMENGLNINKKRELRAICPALSILGSAMGNEMLEGKLKVGLSVPRCKELETSDKSVYDMTSLVQFTRQDDVKLQMGDKWLGAEDKNTKDQNVQMIYEIETLNTGVILDCPIILDSANEIEISCLHRIFELLDQNSIGGKSSAGYGSFNLEFEKDDKNSQIYLTFLKDNKDRIKQFLLNYGI